MRGVSCKSSAEYVRVLARINANLIHGLVAEGVKEIAEMRLAKKLVLCSTLTSFKRTLESAYLKHLTSQARANLVARRPHLSL